MIAAMSLPILFLGYVALIATIVAIAVARSLSARATLAGFAVLALWLGYGGAMGYLGVVGDATLPVPGVFILLTPIIAFVAIVLGRSPVGRVLATSVPPGALVGLQVFRVGVELTLHRLWELGSVPKLMTLAGGNIEILIGISAPLFALIATRGSGGCRIVNQRRIGTPDCTEKGPRTLRQAGTIALAPAQLVGVAEPGRARWGEARL